VPQKEKKGGKAFRGVIQSLGCSKEGLSLKGEEILEGKKVWAATPWAQEKSSKKGKGGGEAQYSIPCVGEEKKPTVSERERSLYNCAKKRGGGGNGSGAYTRPGRITGEKKGSQSSPSPEGGKFSSKKRKEHHTGV